MSSTISANFPASRRLARAAGSLYLVASLLFIGGMALRAQALNQALDTGNAALTFRLGLTLDFVSAVLFLAMSIALYVLLQHVNRLAAAIVVLLVSIQVVIIFVSDINLYAELILSTDSGYVQAMGRTGTQALIKLFARLHSNGIVVDELFFGLWLFPLSYLVVKSKQIPAVIGVLLAVAGIDWIGQFIAGMLAPNLPFVDAAGQVLGIGELVFVVWLLAIGIRQVPAAAPTSP